MLLFCLYNIVLLSLLASLYGSIGIVIVGTVGLGLVCLSIYSKKNTQKLYNVLIVITTVAIGFMLLNYYALIEEYGEPYYALDDKCFEYYGRSLFLDGIINYRDVPYIEGYDNTKGYLVIISWIYRLSGGIAGYHTISPRILNIYLWISIVSLIYKILREKVEDRRAITAMLILAIFPNAMYVSSFVYRDVFVCFLLITGFYNFRIIFNNKPKRVSLIRIILFLYSFYALYYARKQMLYVFMALIVVFILFEFGKPKSIIKRYCVCGIAIGSVFFILFVTNGWNLFIYSLIKYSAYTVTLSDGLSNYIFMMPILPFGWILRMVYGFIVPFPGGILKLDYLGKPLYSLTQLLIQMGTIFQIFLIPYMLKSIKKMDTYVVLWGVCYMAIVMTTFTFRHFIMMYPMLPLCVVPEYVRTDYGKRKKYIVYVLLLLLLCIVSYLVLKMLL